MAQDFEINKSNKAGINDKESLIVTRGTTSYLRIVGQSPSYRIMTATASEDNRQFSVCMDKIRLNAAALQLGSELETQPSFAKDSSGREFVHICTITAKPESDPAENWAQLEKALNRFFELYDSGVPTKPKALNEMREIYRTISSDGSGDDIYLSDGVWLGSDGSLHDRGR